MKSITTRKRFSVVAVAALGLLASACEIETAATELHVITAEEDGLFSDGDEPYVAIVQWRVTPGTVGSTEVSLLTSIDSVLSDGAFDGETLPIPPHEGVVTFDNVVPVASQQLATGSVPEVMGTVVVAMESDANPYSLVNNVFLDVADALADELAGNLETLTFTDPTDEFLITATVVQAIDAVLDEAEVAVDEAIDLWFASLFDPDDLVGVGFTVYLGSAGPLSNLVNFVFEGVLDPTVAGGAWSTNLDPKSDTLDFSNGDATYEVDIIATVTP